MAVLTVNNIEKSFGDEVIIENITFEVQKGDRIGFVGINGSGKTTLFKVLTGAYTPDAGGFVYARDTTAGYMEQHVCKDLERSAFDEVMTVFRHLTDMETELERITETLTGPLPDDELNRLVLRQAELSDGFADLGGLTCRSRARSTLIGLGFEPEQIKSKVGVLSGGQKAKLQLAKMLLSGATLLLLDEPTNHLDISAVEWLEEFLKGYGGAYIVISHDRYFLDKVTNRTFEMEYKHLTVYKGNYSNYLRLKADNRLAMQREYDSKQKEIKRIEGIIEQQRRWNQARNYVTIASKQKQIDRIAQDMERPDSDPATIKFRFKASRRSGDEVLLTENLSLSFDGRTLFRDVNLDIRRGEKVFLIGPNGCGKTSLFKILLGQYTADTGFVKPGVGVDMGYYEQSQSGLHDEKSVIDEIWDIHPGMSMTEVRSALAIFLFRGEDVFKPIGALSGGERARILLLKLMLSTTNFLLLDEPTNHLDISSCEALENALTEYDGTLFVVSHDRYLINKLADKIYYLDKDGVTLYEGNYDAYIEKRDMLRGTLLQKEAEEAKPPADKQSPYKMKKERDAQLRRLRAALNRCEKEIEENDLLLKELEGRLEQPEVSSDYEAALALTGEIAAAHEKAEALLSQWAETSSGIEALEPTKTGETDEN